MKVRGLALLAAVVGASLLALPAQAATPDQVGQWGAVQNWPIVSVHANLEPSGNVLAWDGFDNAPNSEHVFNPSTGTLTAKPYARNLFCSGYSPLPDGRILIAGGHIQVNNGLKDTTLWDTTTNTATRGVDLQNSRWYPTVTTLADGRAMVFSGDNIEADDTPPGTPLSFKAHSLPEVFNPTTSSYTRLTTAQLDTPLYPFMFVLPDGRVFQVGPDQQTHILNTSGTGSWTNGPVSSFDGSSAVMYAPGKVMKSGTWSDPSFPNRTVTGQTAVIDMNQPSPTWRSTAPMAFGRSYENLIALPDGTVLGTGGTSKSDGVNMANAVLPAELWNPQTETWTTMSSQAVGRGYHTTALLLPDGRVLEAGGGRLPGYPITDNTNIEIFSPPYLFKGIRPQISSAPSTVRYGSTFDVGTLDASSISKVSLVRLGSSTHNFDQNQRFVPLNFSTSGGSLSVTAPSGPGSAPPGYYMLFIVDSNGVPSVASFVRFPAAYEDSQAPSAPGSLHASGGVGTVNLGWDPATDDTGIKQYNVHRGTTTGFAPTAANRITQIRGPGGQRRPALERGERKRQRGLNRAVGIRERAGRGRDRLQLGQRDRERVRRRGRGRRAVQARRQQPRQRGHQLALFGHLGHQRGVQRQPHADRRGQGRRRQLEDGRDRERERVEHRAAAGQPGAGAGLRRDVRVHGRRLLGAWQQRLDHGRHADDHRQVRRRATTTWSPCPTRTPSTSQRG